MTSLVWSIANDLHKVSDLQESNSGFDGVNSGSYNLARMLALPASVLHSRDFVYFQPKAETPCWLSFFLIVFSIFGLALSGHFAGKNQFDSPLMAKTRMSSPQNEVSAPSATVVATKGHLLNSPSRSLKANTFFYDLEGVDWMGDPKLRIFPKVYGKTVLEKLVLESIPKNMRERARPFVRPTLKMAQKYRIDPLWALSVMWTESHFRPRSVSHKGAKGLMQIMPPTKRFLKKEVVRTGHSLEIKKGLEKLGHLVPLAQLKKNPRFWKAKLENIELGVFYLSRLSKSFGGQKIATVAYNMGPGWTRKRLRRGRPVGTRNLYLNKVMRAYRTLESGLLHAPGRMVASVGLL